MKAKYRPVQHRTQNTTSTFVEPARQSGNAFPGSSDFVQQLNFKKQQLHHVPPAMVHDASLPLLEKQAAKGFQQQGFTGGNVSYNEAPVLFKSEQRPAVLKERIIPIEEENIQPVVHRQIEKREVHEVIQPIHEKQYLAPVIEEKQLPAESRQFGSYQPRVKEQLPSTVEYAAAEHFKRVNAPIIEETIKKTIIEEVQPVVHRETVAPHIIKETLPIYERIIEPEVVVKETRPMMEAFAPAALDKQVIPAAPALPTQQAAQLPQVLPAENWKSQTWTTTQPALGQETKYVFEIQQKTKLIPQGQLPLEQQSRFTPIQK